MTRSILIVDDEFGLADVIAGLLLDRGWDVEVVINGQLGLDSLARRRPDVVLVDLMMPVMGGSEMIAAMRADPELAAIPAILMTALPEAIVDGGAQVAILAKPFSLAVLFALLERLAPAPAQ